jgi:sugar lactone lactonase YvrE
MYFTHSTERRVYAFDYPSMANERTFYQHTTSGEPDGFAIDVEGHIWQAIYNESRVLRISTQGEVVGEIKLPTKCITCPVFVGTQLWITSGDDEGEEFGGALFRVDVGVKGVAKFQFKLGDKSLLEI